MSVMGKNDSRFLFVLHVTKPTDTLCHDVTLSHVTKSLSAQLSPCQWYRIMCHLVSCHQCQYVSVAKSCAILPTVISVTMSVSLHNVHIVSCCQRHCITMSMSLRHVSPCLLSPVSPCHYVFQWDSKQSYTYVLATVSAVFTTLFLLEVSVSSRTKWPAGFWLVKSSQKWRFRF